jgi:hypothetical protein
MLVCVCVKEIGRVRERRERSGGREVEGERKQEWENRLMDRDGRMEETSVEIGIKMRRERKIRRDEKRREGKD